MVAKYHELWCNNSSSKWELTISCRQMCPPSCGSFALCCCCLHRLECIFEGLRSRDSKSRVLYTQKCLQLRWEYGVRQLCPRPSWGLYLNQQNFVICIENKKIRTWEYLYECNMHYYIWFWEHSFRRRRTKNSHAVFQIMEANTKMGVKQSNPDILF